MGDRPSEIEWQHASDVLMWLALQVRESDKTDVMYVSILLDREMDKAD